jgi:D-3-phosphoglycerate dehydrogenase/C-terminal binding protein
LGIEFDPDIHSHFTSAMPRFQVVLTDYITDTLRPEREALGDIAEFQCLDARGESELLGKIDDADALIVFHNVTLSRATLETLKHCRVIVRCGVGFDNIDGRFARQRGIPLVNVPDYGTEEVADSAIGMTLALTRGIVGHNRVFQRDPGRLWDYQAASPLFRLRGRSFGIIGLGRIGTATAIRAKALGMKVLFYDPYVVDGLDKALGITRVESLEELLRQSFVVSIHCPSTPETRGLICERTLSMMQRGSYLVNTARGPVVDTSIIADAVASGHLAGVGLDVLPIEPPPMDDPLIMAWRDPNHAAHEKVIINPHAAFYCEEGFYEMRFKAASACRMAFEGKALRNVVNWRDEP